jgi:energy-coupling factor transporter ATP-binding protein EcfA2
MRAIKPENFIDEKVNVDDAEKTSVFRSASDIAAAKSSGGLVVILGSDGVGKTSLAQALADLTGKRFAVVSTGVGDGVVSPEDAVSTSNIILTVSEALCEDEALIAQLKERGILFFLRFASDVDGTAAGIAAKAGAVELDGSAMQQELVSMIMKEMRGQAFR